MIVNWILCFHREISHPTRPFVFADAIQNSIRIFGSQWVTGLPIWIFAICGQLLVVYFERLESDLKNLTQLKAKYIRSRCVLQQALVILRLLEKLYHATSLLHRRLRFMLIINCCLSFIVWILSTYYAINFWMEGLILVGFWDFSRVLDSFVRFFAMCYTSDQIRTAVIVDN